MMPQRSQGQRTREFANHRGELGLDSTCAVRVLNKTETEDGLGFQKCPPGCLHGSVG